MSKCIDCCYHEIGRQHKESGYYQGFNLHIFMRCCSCGDTMTSIIPACRKEYEKNQFRVSKEEVEEIDERGIISI